jgi:hypothetical protein
MKHKKTNEYVVIVVLDFMLVMFFLLNNHPAFLYTLMILTFFTVVISPLRKLIAKGFDLITGFIGKIISAVVLGLFFYLFLTPVALIKKISGQTTSSFKKYFRGDSYFTATTKVYNREDFEKMW